MSKQPLILVIDEDELVQDYAVEALRACGYAATAASTPTAALELIRNVSSLQVVLSDIRVGSMAGPALVRQALWHRPELRVVFMTAGGSTDVLVRHTDPILTKPFLLAELCAAIDNVLTQPPSAKRFSGVERRRLPGDGDSSVN